ncbi:MAG: hypothetical protein ACYDAO_00760 [Thermoplasmataceae archaeon]
MKSNASLFSFEEKKGTSNYIRDIPSFLTTGINGQNERDSTGDKETLSIEAMSRCARFDFCSAPKCPLDILIALRTVDEDDSKCEMAKSTRHKYWESMPPEIKKELKFEGYFESEYNRMKSAKERWESLPETKRKEIIDNLRLKKVKA